MLCDILIINEDFFHWYEWDHWEMKAILLIIQDKNYLHPNSPNFFLYIWNYIGGPNNWYFDVTHNKIEQ